jgi:hypothetical protein
MTKHYGTGAGAGITQAALAPQRAERAAGTQTVQALRPASGTAAAAGPASGTAAALPADPFAGRSWRSGAGRLRLSGRPAVFVLASLIVALLASSAAPTPLYAIYQAKWHFTPITTTVVFGVYAMAVLISLLTLGKLSDHIGRRPVLLTAIAVHAGSLVIFATATGVPALLTARVVQGLSTGAALGAIGAAMLDMDRELGTFANAVAPGLGSASGAILSPVLTAVPVLFAVWALAGLYGALGPALVHALTGSGEVVLGALSLTVLAGSAVVAIIALRRTAARTVMLVGIWALIAGVGVTVLAVSVGSVALFFAGSVIAGVGFGSGFQGGIRLVVPLAAAHERGGLISLLYVVSYLGLGVPAVLAGFGVVHGGGLIDTARYYGAAVIALAAAALFGLLKTRPGRAAEPAAAPARGI